MPRALSELRGRALWVVIGCFIVQLGVGYGYVAAPLSSFLLETFGWSRAELSAAWIAQPILLSLASPLVGFMAARFGARFVLASGAIVLGSTFMLGARIETQAHLVGMWAVQGLSVTLLGDIAVGSVVTQWTRKSRALALGIAYTGANVGGALVARTLVAVAEAASWRVGLFVLGAAAIAILLPAALLLVRDRAPVLEDGAPDPEQDPEPEEALPIREVLATPTFWVLCFSHVSYWLFLVMMTQHFVLMLMDTGLPRSEATAHFANTTLIGGAAKIAFGFLALRMTARNAMLLDFALLSLAAALLLLIEHPWVVHIFVVVWAFGYAARDIVTPLVIARCFGTRVVAQVYGLVMLTFLLSPLGGIGAGFAFDLTGSYRPAIMVVGGLIATSLCLIFLIPNDRRAR